MSGDGRETENKSGNNWWITGAALLLGYYVGQGEKPADGGRDYAEAVSPIATSPVDADVTPVGAETSSPELLAAVETEGEWQTDAADEDAAADASDEGNDEYASLQPSAAP